MPDNSGESSSVLSKIRYQIHHARVVHPYLLPFSVVFCAAAVLAAAAGFYYELAYTRPKYANFPPSVAQALRQGIYFSEIRVEPGLAYDHFMTAIARCELTEMDPMSDEVLGIKLRFAAFLEKVGRMRGAVEVLERTRAECLAWINEERRKAKERREGRLRDSEGKEVRYSMAQEELEERSKGRVLKKCVGIGSKLGELYASDWIQNDAKAEDNLVAAVELALKENQWREQHHITEEHIDASDMGETSGWMSSGEVGMVLERLGSWYEQKNQHILAAPLFLQALSLIRQDEGKASCKQVVLMNNLASSMAQQRPIASPGMPVPSMESLVESAKAWSKKALEIAAATQPPERTEECDLGCAVATHNLGEMAEMLGDMGEAKRRYQEAASLAKAIGFTEGMQNAQEGIQRLQGKA